jgi:DNA-binding HxlR family transcriptional regulator
LRQQLRQMEADGLIGKRILTPRHRGVRYRVTRYGRTLEPVFETLWRWGRRHVARRNTAGTLATAPRTIAIPS